MSIFGTTGICESFMPIFVLFAKDSVEWPETGKQGGDLPLQRGQKYRNNGKSAAPKRRGGQKAAVGLQGGQETAKSLAAKAAGEKARLLRSAHKETLPQNLAKTGCWLRCRPKDAGVPARCLRPAFAILLLRSFAACCSASAGRAALFVPDGALHFGRFAVYLF